MKHRFYIYHVPGVKIGCSQNIKKRINHQKITNYEILEEHTDVYLASNREIELQKQYGYKVDVIPYYQSLKMITKAQKISKETKDIWLPNVDWKAREAKIDQNTKWNKVKSSEGYKNRKIANGSEQLKKTLLQYDLDGNFIKEWKCGSSNMPEEYKHAGGCANTKSRNKTLYGFQWRYKTLTNYSKQIGKFENEMSQKVIQKDLKGNIIKIWNNQTEAANLIGCSVTLISNVCRGIGKTAKGFIWERFV
jgi:hypothetical protein